MIDRLENEVGRRLGDVEVVSTVEGTDVVHALIVGREIRTCRRSADMPGASCYK